MTKNCIFLIFFSPLVWKLQFWKPRLKSFDRCRKFITQCPETLKKNFFSRQNFPYSCSSGQVQGNFDNPVKKYSQNSKKIFLKGEKVSLNVPKRPKYELFFRKKRNFSWKSSYGHVKCSFDNHVGKLCQKVKKFRSLSKNDKKKQIYQKIVSSQSVRMDK